MEDIITSQAPKKPDPKFVTVLVGTDPFMFYHKLAVKKS